MKKILTILIISFIIYSISSITFGNNFNLNVEGNNNLGEFYIGKVEEGFSYQGIEEYKKINNTKLLNFSYKNDSDDKYGDMTLKILGRGFYINNNYSLGDNFELKGRIKEKVLQKVGFRNYFDMKKGDVVLFEQNFLNSKENLENTKKAIGENIVVSKAVDDNFIFQKTFKIKCFEDNFYTYDSLVFPLIGWSGEENISNNYHNNIGLEKYNIQRKLKKTFKNCSNFNKLFNVETNNILNYKYKDGYTLKKEKYLYRLLSSKFGEYFKKLNYEKKVILFEKIEELRTEKNNDKNLTQEQKDNVNILLDALVETLK